MLFKMPDVSHPLNDPEIQSPSQEPEITSPPVTDVPHPEDAPEREAERRDKVSL